MDCYLKCSFKYDTDSTLTGGDDSGVVMAVCTAVRSIIILQSLSAFWPLRLLTPLEICDVFWHKCVCAHTRVCVCACVRKKRGRIGQLHTHYNRCYIRGERKREVRSVVSMVTEMSAKGHGTPLFFQVRERTHACTITHTYTLQTSR